MLPSDWQDANAMSHRYGIDSLLVRNDRCFGWGWFLDDGQPALQCELRLTLASGAEQSLVCVPGGMREDLRAAFPDVSHAGAAGFMVQGKLQGRIAQGVPATLVVTLRDGSLRYCEVPSPAGAPAGRRLRWWEAAKAGIAKAWAGLRQHGVVDFTSRAWRITRGRAAFALLRFRRARVVLVFDHAMGGGANKYRHQLIDRLAADGDPVVLVTPLLHMLQYQVVLHSRGREERRLVDDLGGLLETLGRLARLDVHVNDLVSFGSPLDVLSWCLARRGAKQGELVFHLHDYHAVCPAWTLVGVDGRFCGVPELRECRRCLPANHANTLGFSHGVQVPEWRLAWGRFLEGCDRIVAFSRASVDILHRAFPALREDRILIQPHQPDLHSLRPVRPRSSAHLVIAVAGNISAAKGAVVLRDMAALIRRNRLPIRIVVFGTLEHHDAADGIEVLGRYAPGELPDLLERHHATVCFLPSVCAETFSFVTAEFMAMDMPVAVFPVGAPAERVARYDQGLVISKIDAATAVDEIFRFATQWWQPSNTKAG